MSKRPGVDSSPPNLAAALQRSFAQILRRAVAELDALGEDPVGAVHEFRKGVRRVRGLVVLARPWCESQRHEALRRSLQRAFRRTGGLRDGAVRIETLQRLGRPWNDGDEARQVLATLRSLVVSDGDQLRELTAAVEELLQAPAALRDALAAAGVTPDLEALERALARVLKRTRRAFDRACQCGADEAFHAWRKRVKDQRAVLDLIAGWGSTQNLAPSRPLSTLAKRLGALTDLILLRRALPDTAGAGRLARSLERRIVARKRRLLVWGAALHAAPPRRVAARLRGALQETWQAERRERVSPSVAASRESSLTPRPIAQRPVEAERSDVTQGPSWPHGLVPRTK